MAFSIAAIRGVTTREVGIASNFLEPWHEFLEGAFPFRRRLSLIKRQLMVGADNWYTMITGNTKLLFAHPPSGMSAYLRNSKF